MDDLGDVLVGITYRGVSSNRVRVGIGQIGGGPPDDPGAVPTPGGTPGPPLATAGTLTTSDVQTIISQAVSAAVSLNRNVTVAVSDREANVLGVFSMTGAPGTKLFAVSAPQHGLEGSVVPSSLAAFSKAGTVLFSAPGGMRSHATADSSFRNTFHLALISTKRPAVRCAVLFPTVLRYQNSRLAARSLADPGDANLQRRTRSRRVGIEGDGIYTRRS